MLAHLQASLLILLLAVTASAQSVRITWIGQAGFYIQTEGGPLVVVDPPSANLGYPLPATAADVVTITHAHGDHSNSAGVRGAFTLVDGRPTTQRTEATAAGMPFVLVPGFHDSTGSTRNTIIRWTQGGLRFAHFGDYGQASLTEEQLADLRDLDVLMVPGGGGPTIDMRGAAAVVEQLKPRIAILMHFRTAIGGAAQLGTHPAVTGPYPQIRYKPANVTLTRATLPASPEVWAMEPAADAAVVNTAGFVAGAPLAPGSIASAFGTFAGSATASYTGASLPRRLGETEVLIGTDTVPLFYVSPGQINFQVPRGLTTGQSVFEVRVGGQRVGRGSLTTVARSPGLFAVVDADGRLGRGRRGGFITIYASGQGSVAPVVADAAPSPTDPLARTPDAPVVLIGGRRATVTFSGLTPGYFGLWQINAQISEDTPTGASNELVVQFDANLSSNAINIAVE